MLAFLRTYGDLDPDLRFKGTPRSGYTTLPGAGAQAGDHREPLPLATLLDIDMWSAVLFEEAFDFQATMLQPVGGMDRIPLALAKKLKDRVRLMSEVTAIRRSGDGVRVDYADKRSGRRNSITGAYCLVTVPLPVLAAIECDFAAPHRAAIRGTAYGDAVKIAWQAPRFWETEAHIYGGISWVKGPTALVWYPSDRLFSAKGILLGGYVFGSAATALAQRPLAEQLDLGRAAVEGLHPGHGRDLDKPMAIAWSKVPYSLGIGGALHRRHGLQLHIIERARRAILLRRRAFKSCRAVAGGRHPLRPPGDHHDGRASAGAPGVGWGETHHGRQRRRWVSLTLHPEKALWFQRSRVSQAPAIRTSGSIRS